MSNVYIYLAGPISGCTGGEAHHWRDVVCNELDKASPHLIGVSPLRCEPIIGTRYENEYDDDRFGLPQVIAAKNYLDVKRCDVTLAYMPTLSIGTLQEIGWCKPLGKPVILISDLPEIRNNAVIKATVPWRFTYADNGFEKAVDVIRGIYEVYA